MFHIFITDDNNMCVCFFFQKWLSTCVESFFKIYNVVLSWCLGAYKLLRRSSLHLLSVPLLQTMESLIVEDMQDWKQKLTHLTFMALGTGQSKLPLVYLILLSTIVWSLHLLTPGQIFFLVHNCLHNNFLVYTISEYWY